MIIYKKNQLFLDICIFDQNKDKDKDKDKT